MTVFLAKMRVRGPEDYETLRVDGKQAVALLALRCVILTSEVSSWVTLERVWLQMPLGRGRILVVGLRASFRPEEDGPLEPA